MDAISARRKVPTRGKLGCEVMEKVWRDRGTNITGGYWADWYEEREHGAGFLKVSDFCMLRKYPSTSTWLRVPWNGCWVSWNAFQASRDFRRADVLPLL